MRIFLSHSSRDKHFVRRLADELKRAGIEIWFDEVDLRIGDSLARIKHDIGECQGVIVAVSKASGESIWVRHEVEVARAIDGMRILPILLDGPEPADTVAADFRDSAHYRRTVEKLIATIKGLPRPERLTARQAALKVKREFPRAGELFGLSQQGVNTLYHLANVHDWVSCDASLGRSRLWIVEMYLRSDGAVYPFAVMDEQIHELPVMHRLDRDPAPVPESAIVYSCALNHLPGISEEEARAIIQENPSRFAHVARRYTLFRPVPLTRAFIDSDVAVAAATDSPRARTVIEQRAQEIFTLTKLECDKQHGNSVLWKVSFFDEALDESVLTVGIDAVTGKVRYPAMRAELLNVDFMDIRRDDSGNIVISIANQVRAIDSREWDIVIPGKRASRLTAAQALHLAYVHLGDEAERWQLGFLSNTGVIRTIAAPARAPEERLMRADGGAGQWVVELCGWKATPVDEPDRKGFAYDYRVLVITPEGVETVEKSGTCGMTSPLASSPLPAGFGVAYREIYEEAHALALQSTHVEFHAMSVALDRPPGGARWRFRFYDADDIVEQVWISTDGKRVIGP